MQVDLNRYLTEGCTLTSSGTTGAPKKIYRSPENIKNSIEVSIDSQQIVSHHKILTVTSLAHAGGLLTQTLPAAYLGAVYHISAFNPKSFFSLFEPFTHTFLPPRFMEVLIRSPVFKHISLKDKWILTGSDPVSWDIIEKFVEKGAVVQPNWGMSEIGPLTLNTIFKDLDQVREYKRRINGATILGDNVYCDTKIIDGILHVKGPTCYKEGWLNTLDKVDFVDNIFTYIGRQYS
jgi:acyl-CoA synthetase (AMP-forming)/AMP-acid ligase II